MIKLNSAGHDHQTVQILLPGSTVVFVLLGQTISLDVLVNLTQGILWAIMGNISM